MIRSIATFYSSGVMGKKYQSVYRASSYNKSTENPGHSIRITVSNCPIPRLVPYNKLMPFIKSIDIGKLYNVSETLCYDMDEEHKIEGCYRDLKELLPRLAKFYIDTGMYELTFFNDEANLFHVSLGGDGAPFGKDDTAVAWLVGLLNIGKGILSSNDNFLLLGANCSEDSVVMKSKILPDIHYIESNSFPVECNSGTVNVRFAFSELPNDMKMLAFLSGELNNSAKYFSSFADVSYDEINDCKGTFGETSTDKWRPWSYSKRIQVVNELDRFKKELEKKKISASTKRTRVTEFISQKKSRQGFVPLLGQKINRAHVQPLHIKNNACAYAQRIMLNKIIACSNLSNSVNSFSQVPNTAALFTYVQTFEKKMSSQQVGKEDYIMV